MLDEPIIFYDGGTLFLWILKAIIQLHIYKSFQSTIFTVAWDIKWSLSYCSIYIYLNIFQGLKLKVPYFTWFTGIATTIKIICMKFLHNVSIAHVKCKLHNVPESSDKMAYFFVNFCILQPIIWNIFYLHIFSDQRHNVSHMKVILYYNSFPFHLSINHFHPKQNGKCIHAKDLKRNNKYSEY